MFILCSDPQEVSLSGMTFSTPELGLPPPYLHDTYMPIILPTHEMFDLEGKWYKKLEQKGSTLGLSQIQAINPLGPF